jgi:tungstate transport system ATP-binding protein
MIAPVALESVTKRYGDVTALGGADLVIHEGEVFGIVGPSGAGKTTLLRIIDFLETVDEGKVSILGKEANPSSQEADKIRLQIGMVHQKPVVLNRSVANNLVYPLMIRGWDESRISAAVDRELKRLGLENRRGKNARTLSGGEMQRVSFSRTTIFSPRLLLLDEFAANLDPANVALLEGMVRGYMEEDPSRATVLVTHNLFQAKRMCDRVGLMWDGRFVEIADRERFFEDPGDERTAAFVKGDLVY